MSSHGGWGPPRPPAGGWPQYGPPPVQPHLQPPPPRPQLQRRRGPSRGPILLLGGALVALVVAIVVVASVLTAGGGDDSKLSQSWTVPKPDQQGDATTVVAYPTVDGKTFVRVSLYAVIGYDMATGKTRWSIRMPAHTAVCASTHGAPGGVAAVVFGKGGCTNVIAVEVSTGKRLWSVAPPVLDSSDPPHSAALAAVGGKLYVTNTERMIAYDAKAGPNGTGSAKPVQTKPGGSQCGFSGVSASAARLVTIEVCADEHRSLVGLDPKTLRAAFRTPLQVDDDEDVNVVSVHPLVLHATNALDNGELRIFDDTGRQTKVFSSRQTEGTLALAGSAAGGYHDDNVAFPVRVVGSTLVALVDDDDYGVERKAAGVDLRTGSWAWTKSLDTKNDVKMANGDNPRKVAVFTEGGYGGGMRKEPPRVLYLDPAVGDVTKGHSLDVGDDYESFLSASVFAVRDQLIVLRVLTSFDGPIITAYGK